MAGHLFTKDRSIREIFEEVQRLLLTTGSPWLPPAKKEKVLFLGDKKPVQMTDERLFQYALQHFSGCKFIHVMRDPVDWLVSYHNNVKEPKRNVHELLAFWLRNEQRIISFRQRAEICSFTYGALCNQTETILKKVFEFLGLQSGLSGLKIEPTRYKSYRQHIHIQAPPEIEAFWQDQREILNKVELFRPG